MYLDIHHGEHLGDIGDINQSQYHKATCDIIVDQYYQCHSNAISYIICLRRNKTGIYFWSSENSDARNDSKGVSEKCLENNFWVDN